MPNMRIDFGYGTEALLKKLLESLTKKADAETELAKAKAREINARNGWGS